MLQRLRFPLINQHLVGATFNNKDVLISFRREDDIGIKLKLSFLSPPSLNSTPLCLLTLTFQLILLTKGSWTHLYHRLEDVKCVSTYMADKIFTPAAWHGGKKTWVLSPVCTRHIISPVVAVPGPWINPELGEARCGRPLYNIPDSEGALTCYNCVIIHVCRYSWLSNITFSICVVLNLK